jgi:hypothetical protein
MNDLFSADALISLLTLTILEIVLGVDNVIFVSIIMGRLNQAKQKTARRIWMLTGVLVRVLLLLSLTWLLKNGNATLFAIGDKEFNLRGLIMLSGGLFLLTKTVGEIHQKLEGAEHETTSKNKGGNLVKIVIQMMLVDTVFSFDSIITAVGMAQHVEIMITAVVVAMFIMFLFSGKIADFVEKHPTVKMLALSFLVMIGFVLLIEGWDAEKAHELHLKNYVYFSMAFSFAVELLNLQLRKKSKAVELREPHLDDIDEEQ